MVCVRTTWKRYLKRAGAVLVVFYNNLLLEFVSELPEKDASTVVVQCPLNPVIS